MIPTHRSFRQAPDADDSADQFDPDMSNRVGTANTQYLIQQFIGRWYWITLGLILGLLAASYYLAKTPKKYSATSTLLIKQQTSSIMMSRDRDASESIDLRSIEAMNTVAAQVRRMDLLERVAARADVRQLEGLMPAPVNWMPDWVAKKLDTVTSDGTELQGPPAPAILADMMNRWLKVTITKGTRLLDISITHPVPEIAKSVANAIAREYLAEIAGNRTTSRGNSIDLLEKESREARINLQSARSARSIYARALDVHTILDAKEVEQRALQLRYLPKHPKMIAGSAELKQLQENFIREFDISRQAVSDKAYWDVAAGELPDSTKNPDEYLRVARQQLLARIGVLESEIQSATIVFNNMLTQIKETSVNQEAADSSAEVSNLARLPGLPSAPVPAIILAMGAMGGLGGGLFLAFLIIHFDNKFHTVSQVVSETGINVLAAISEIKLHHLEVAERQHEENNPNDQEDFHKNWDRRLVFRRGASTTSYAEMYRVLRASISLLGDESKRKITLFTSSLPGEGKTLTSANFALAAAGQGRKTLLIDMDLRKPAVHKLFGLPRIQKQGGITECLANLATFEQVICYESGHPNLHLILSGAQAPNPGELLENARLHAVLQQACREYDLVVLDTAPILAVPDTRILAPLAHNLCLVAQAEYVPKGAIFRTLTILEEDGTPLSGIVFNNFKESRRLMGENYSYGYYKPSRSGSSYRYGYGAYGVYGSEETSKNKKK